MNHRQASLMRIAACFLFSILLLWNVAPLAAQSVDWEKTHGSSVSGYSVQRLDDGGFIAVGAGGQWPATTGYLIRTDSVGAKVWEKTIGTGNPGVWAASVKKSADGGFAIVGSKNSMPWLWKYTSDGGESWSRQVMGPDSYGDARSVVTVPDGIVVTGTNSIAGKYKLFVHKFSLAGDSLWSIQYTGKESDGYGIRQGLDGNFLIAGRIDNGDGYESYLVKVSSAGAKMWEKSYPKVAGTFGDAANDVSIASDGYLLVGSRSIDNNNTQMDAIKVTLDGTLSWRKQFGPAGYGGINAVRPLTDGFILAGYTGTSQTTVARVMKIDKDGGVTADKTLDASFLHYVDQAIPPMKFVVVGGTSDFTKMYLARVDMTSTTPQSQDGKTFVYHYNNQPLWAIATSNGWTGDGPGRIKLVAAKDTVRINGMARIAATKFSIDTTRVTPIGSMSVQMTGELLATGAQSAGKTVIAKGNVIAMIEQAGLRFTQAIQSDSAKGPGGTTIKVDLLQPGAYPASTEYKISGRLTAVMFQACGPTSNGIEFSGLHITSQSPAPIDYVGDISLEGAVCLYNVVASYDQLQDKLNLAGDFVSQRYFPSGVRASGSYSGNRLSPFTLTATVAEVPLGPAGNALIRNFSGTYFKEVTWYVPNLSDVRHAYQTVITKIYLDGVLRDKGNKFEIDLNDAIVHNGLLFTNTPTNYRMYKVGDQWHIHGNSNIELEWGSNTVDFRTSDNKGDFFAVGKKNTDQFYFAGRGGGQASTSNGKATEIKGLAHGYVELPAEFGIYLEAMGHLNEVVKAMLLQKVVQATAMLKDDTAYVMPVYPGYILGPIVFNLSKASNDLAFARPPSYSEMILGWFLSRSKFQGRARDKGHETSALSQSFEVPQNARAVYIRISGSDGADATEITSPSGTFSAPTADSSVQRLDIDPNTYWWIINKPEAGQWSISSAASGDSVLIHVFKPLPSFEIAATQSGESVNVTWEATPDDDVEIFLDKDGEGYDGISVAKVLGGAGNAQFTIPSDVLGCDFRVYAFRRYAGELQTDYADAAITHEPSVSSPSGFTASYDAKDTVAEVMWNASTDLAIAGYAVRLVGNGIDSVITTRYRDENELVFRLENPVGYSVSIMAYDTNGSRSCWSALVPLSTSSVKQQYVATKTLDAVVLPNPSRSRASLYLRMDEGSDVRVTIYDATGRSINALSGFYPMGEHDIDLQTEQLPSGSYVAIIEAGTKTQTRNFVITR
jgi:hypothetical protein